MTLRWPPLSDARFVRVIPAKAGIQVLNGIARVVRDSRGFVARMKRSEIREGFCRAAFGRAYLWVADPRQVTFLCLSKEKLPKEKTPRSARNPLAFLAPRAQTRARLNTPGGAAVLGARYEGMKSWYWH
jgi:hypothetical protein